MRSIRFDGGFEELLRLTVPPGHGHLGLTAVTGSGNPVVAVNEPPARAAHEHRRDAVEDLRQGLDVGRVKAIAHGGPWLQGFEADLVGTAGSVTTIHDGRVPIRHEAATGFSESAMSFSHKGDLAPC